MSVVEQFSRWPYPDATDLSAESQNRFDLTSDHTILWPDREYNPGIEILVAGCGTVEAAVLAYDNPMAHVVGIDISSPSLRRCEAFKKEHRLENLDLCRLDLRDANQLQRQFDLIICSGVLHHLDEAATGLTALGATLKADGAMLLTLYRRHPRLGVYMVQDALRRLNVGQTEEDIAFTREVLTALPSGHLLFANTPRAMILSGSDTDIVDTFLNRYDRAFSVSEVLDTIATSGLSFQCWLDNGEYFPDAYFHGSGELAQRIGSMTLREQWAVTELLAPVPGRHQVVIRKTSAATIDIGASIGDSRLRDMKPALRRGTSISQQPDNTVSLHRGWHHMRLDRIQEAIVRAMDGSRSVMDILDGRPAAADSQHLDFLRRFWRLGHVILSV